MAQYQIPQKVFFGQALPRNATGKFLEKELRAKVEKLELKERVVEILKELKEKV